MRFFLLCLVAAATASAVEIRSQVVKGAMAEIANMIKDLIKKNKASTVEREKAIAVFNTWYTTETEYAEKRVAENKSKKNTAKADIDKYTARGDKLSAEINHMNGNVARWEADKAAAVAVRGIENREYKAMHRDLSESIDAIGRAEKTLASKQGDTAQAAMLLQSLNYVPQSAKSIVDEFLQKPAVPQAAAYKSQSGGVMSMLAKLKREFIEERRAVEKKEQDSVNAFEVLSQDLANDIKFNGDEIKAKEVRLQTSNTKQSGAEGDFADYGSSIDEDKKKMKDMEAESDAKNAEYRRLTIQAEAELESLKETLYEVSTDNAMGAEAAESSAFLQVESVSTNPLQQRAAELLAARGQKFHSQMLSQMATSVGGDVFKKVKRMIKDMIVKLMEEANEESKQKGWCDTELATNKNTRQRKTENVETLFANSEEHTAVIARLTAEIQEHNEAIAQSRKSLKMRSDQRDEDKFENEMTIRDAKNGQEQLDKAIAVVNQLMGKMEESAKAANLSAQSTGDSGTSIADNSAVMSSGLKSVVDMCEGAKTRMEELEQKTAVNEEEDVQEFTEFRRDEEEFVAMSQKKAEQKASKKGEMQKELSEFNDDLAANQAALDEANRYYEKLKPTCVTAGESHEERVARRQEEIDSLKDALQILQGDEM